MLAVPPDHSLAALKARHELDEFLSNRQKRKRPKFACETNILSVSKRTALNIPARQQIQIGKQLDIEEAHCIARRQLAMQHRACHERFRNTVISSGERIMNIVTSEENVMAYNKNQLIEFTRNKIIESTIHHTNVLVSNKSKRHPFSTSSSQLQNNTHLSFFLVIQEGND